MQLRVHIYFFLLFGLSVKHLLLMLKHRRLFKWAALRWVPRREFGLKVLTRMVRMADQQTGFGLRRRRFWSRLDIDGRFRRAACWRDKCLLIRSRLISEAAKKGLFHLKSTMLFKALSFKGKHCLLSKGRQIEILGQVTATSLFNDHLIGPILLLISVGSAWKHGMRYKLKATERAEETPTCHSVCYLIWNDSDSLEAFKYWKHS